MSKSGILSIKEIENCIYTIRDKQVMLDEDLANMYQVETKILNRTAKRNIHRFPPAFRFQLTKEEYQNLRFQFGTSRSNDSEQIITKTHGGRRFMPWAFNEQGVAMLSAVLNSEIAVEVSIQIMDAFVEMRKMLLGNAGLLQRLDKIELKQIEGDQKFEQIFKALESAHTLPEKGVFYDGQIFDAYKFVSDIIKTAKKSILLIDNYVDDSVLTLLDKRAKNVTATIYTKAISKQLKLDLEKHNAQYPGIEIKEFAKAHDRFIIIDETELYHIGASLKDLGKKWFAFSKMDNSTPQMLIQINES